MGASQADRQRRRQKKLERTRSRAANRKRGHGRVEAAVGDPSTTLLLEASTWPVHECLVDPCWRTPPALAVVLVARRGPEGQLAVATFLVDLGCLGAKNGFATLVSAATYASLRERAFRRGREPCTLALAAKIVRSGIAYAERLGFHPHRDVLPALALLGPVEPCDVDVPLGGDDGMPCYIGGPDDDPAQIIRQLNSRLGPDGFHFTAPIDPDELDEAFEASESDDDTRGSEPSPDVDEV